MNLFQQEIEQISIERIQKFAKIAKTMGFEVALGFSGGKDSQVCYDLCKRSGIAFKAYFNHCFESNVTIRFIRENYPDVIFRRVVKEGFIRNIRVNHRGFLPTVQSAYCCFDYKHNPKSVDDCSIVGVQKAESTKRRSRTAFEARLFRSSTGKYINADINGAVNILRKVVGDSDCINQITGNGRLLRPIRYSSPFEVA